MRAHDLSIMHKLGIPSPSGMTLYNCLQRIKKKDQNLQIPSACLSLSLEYVSVSTCIPCQQSTTRVTCQHVNTGVCDRVHWMYLDKPTQCIQTFINHRRAGINSLDEARGHTCNFLYFFYRSADFLDTAHMLLGAVDMLFTLSVCLSN